ncbi:hypothetical protein [Vibrio nigripulchritudo]|uniref:hypothetical protein n=1 Tax=Vibrio nigripulchritudo TaxID=28173 RepID=UPI0005FA273D|nr:hypothetical protein [Vibrio nigripulchritudo]KJY79562.1 hypothetical protein TW74_08950 [Vibrio nigripulchritudo]
MQEISGTLSEENSDISPEIENTPKITIRAPRKPIWEFFLAFSTLGLYSNIWLYRRAKELNLLSQSKFITWLWLLVPFFALAQIFAFKKFGETLETFEQDDKAKKSRNRYFLGCCGFVFSTMYYSISSNWSIALWIDFAVYITFSLSFMFIANRFNEVRKELSHVEFKGKSGYSPFEWVIVAIFFPLIFAGFSYTAISPLFIEQHESYANREKYTIENEEFVLTFQGDNWHRVEVGTFSDGSALAEFSNSVPDSYFLLFKNNEIEDMNEHLQFRRDWIKENIKQLKCTERRSFVRPTLHVKTQLKCHGTMSLDPSTALITVIQTPNNNYELIGFISARKNTYRESVRSFETMAWEFTTQ